MRTVYLWSEMRREQFPPLVEQGGVVIVPTGSTEQHGTHLPVNTDISNVSHIAAEVSRTVEEFPVVVAPPVWGGMSPHHKMFPGVISIPLDTFVRYIRDVCVGITAGGFERILLLNGHGGNRALLEAICYELRGDLSIGVSALSWWLVVAHELEELREGKGSGVGHAGEIETSLQMYLQEQLVDRTKLELVPGVSDDPSLGSKEKGQKIFEAVVYRVAEYLREWKAMTKLEPPRRDVFQRIG